MLSTTEKFEILSKKVELEISNGTGAVFSGTKESVHFEPIKAYVIFYIRYEDGTLMTREEEFRPYHLGQTWSFSILVDRIWEQAVSYKIVDN